MPEPTTACLWPLSLPPPPSSPSAHFIDGRAEPASGDRTRIWLLKAEGPGPPGGGAREGAPLAGWRVRGSWVQAAPSPFPSRDLCVWGRYPKIVAVGGGPVWSEIRGLGIFCSDASCQAEDTEVLQHFQVAWQPGWAAVCLECWRDSLGFAADGLGGWFLLLEQDCGLGRRRPEEPPGCMFRVLACWPFAVPSFLGVL